MQVCLSHHLSIKTEATLGILFLASLVLKVLNIPGANPLLIISLASLGMIYFPVAFYFFCDKELKRQNMVLSIVAGLFLSLIPIGILFKLMYWPGATIYLLIGLVVTPILMLLSYFLRAKAPEHLYRYYTNMLIRSSIWGVLVFVLYFTSSATLLRIQYWHDPELARLKALHYTYPDNKAYTHQHDAYIQKKDSLR